MLYRLLAAVLIVSGAATPGEHQAQSLRTVFDVFTGNIRTGTDEYVVARQTTADGFEMTLRSDVTITDGSRISIEASYDSSWQPLRIQYSRDGNRDTRTWTRFGARKVTFRSVTQGAETAREFARRGTFVLIDDQVPSLFHVLQFLEPGPVTTVSPSDATRTDGTVVDHGIVERSFDAFTLAVHHIELVLPDGARHAWYDASGALVAIETGGDGRSIRRQR